ncbi:Uncharacterised protein [Mycobacteroides abscessus subsp. massiliense]|nr:Uncharacterised protein [Mycobacteroides abscessus subsp. massiliense]SKR73758.1 Uncharacterised protein [Mycobacteroides abscessus subsp. massiliense]SKT61735.1 Uncharacterised protein [Mycobacteroides abscessus subsp. massiliense]SKT94655.1 Uncharacterised protein [Mycobacteroides abscessus subsp. massiliense]SLA44245.1 Uncharacterised protein [Mycobacteroides abscessus subsp. massiliense]
MRKATKSFASNRYLRAQIEVLITILRRKNDQEVVK